MIAIRRVAQRLFWPSVIGTVCAVLAGVILAIAGEGTIAAIVFGAVALLAIPFLAFAFATAPPGLAWQGRYAEPWRSERAPGEWSAIEHDRYDRDVRKP